MSQAEQQKPEQLLQRIDGAQKWAFAFDTIIPLVNDNVDENISICSSEFLPVQAVCAAINPN